MGNGHDHFLTLDKVFDIRFKLGLDQFGPARCAELLPDFGHFIDHDLEHTGTVCQNVEIVTNLVGDLTEVFSDLVPLETGQAMQAQIKDRLGLSFAEPVGLISRLIKVRGITFDQLDQRCHVCGWPFAREHFRSCFLWIGSTTDQLDHLIEIGNRNSQTDQGMGALAGFAELIDGPAGDHLLAEINECLDDVTQGHGLRTTAIQRQHVTAEAGLQRRVFEQLSQHHIGHGIALQLDHHAHAVAVTLVTQIGNTLDDLLIDHLGNPLNQAGLVHLIRDFGDDDRFTVLTEGLDMGAAAHHDRAIALAIGTIDTGLAENLTAGREVRTGHMLHQRFDTDIGIFDIGDTGVDHLAEIMRRNISRHTNRDTTGTIDQHIRIACGQNHRFFGLFVIVGLEIDGVLVDIGQQAFRRLGQTGLGVTHGRSRIAIHRAEIALTVNQWKAHGEILRHPHHGVVNRAVTMGVILTHDVTDDTGRFAERLGAVISAHFHGVEDTAVHRLQAVAHIRQRTADDYAHRIIEIGATQLGLNRDGSDIGVVTRLIRQGS